MANIYEEISKSHAQGGGKTDANLANDANHLGGVPAEQYATKKYVQDYHNTKESAQKEYIDEQDSKTLQEAKEYTNSQIRNQDFSTFAKLTDVQAVDKKLTNKIEECSQQCATNLATQIKNVVDDTNANFSDVNNAITTLNNTTNQLFQSVSDGKSKIAGAITDKGVTTSANDSFDTMAGNIRSIQSGGGGEIDENFVNTSDATATASDILLGKTAYAQGQKIYGGLVYPETEDSSDATATPYDIVTGKTAYVQGKKIQGILNVDENSKPSYDIGAVEKIYGTATGEMIKHTENIPFGNTTYYGYNDYVLLKNSKSNMIYGYIKTTVENYVGYLETALYSESNGFYNKKKYKFADLGITLPYTDITGMWCNEFNNNNNYFVIAFNPKSKTLQNDACFVYKIKESVEHTGSGTAYSYLEIDVKCKWVIPMGAILTSGSYYYYTESIVFSKNNPNIIAILKLYTNGSARYLSVIKLSDIDTELGIDEFADIEWERKSGNYGLNVQMFGSPLIRFRASDKIIEMMTANKYAGSSGCVHRLVVLDNYTPIKTTVLGNNVMTSGGCFFINEVCTIAKKITGRPSTGFTIQHYDIVIDYASGVITVTEDSTKTISMPAIPELSEITDYLQYLVTDDNFINGVALFRYYDYTSSSCKYFYYVKCKIDFNNAIPISFDTKISDKISNPSIAREYLSMIEITGDGKCLYYGNKNNGKVCTYVSVNDYSKVIGLKYEGEYYYKQDPKVLTAGKPDVRAGKTFIGWMGYPEVGTMNEEAENNE